MRSPRLLPALLLLLLLAVDSASAQRRRQPAKRAIEQSLLWRITGNGLKRPSYLYGTMHVRLKEVFDFADSVLPALERCSRFATEAHLDSFARAWVARQFASELEAAEAARMINDLPGATHSESNEHAWSPPYSGAEDRLLGGLAKQREVEDSSVFLDAWLFALARDLGKRLRGVESVEETLAMADDLGNDGIENGEMNFLEALGLQRSMLDAYVKGDIEHLEKIMRRALAPASFDALLTRRNHRMVTRIIEYAREEPTFVAIGAGHLGGAEGVIALLRTRGFDVSPVVATRKGEKGSFVRPESRHRWSSFVAPLGAFALEVPIEPVAYPEEEQGSGYWVSPDIGGGLQYAFGYSDMPPGYYPSPPHQLLDETLSRLRDSYGGSILSRRFDDSLTPRTLDAIGKTSDSEGFRARVIARGRRLYSMIVFGPDELLENASADRFFGSFALRPQQESPWGEHRSEEDLFSVSFPGTPEIMGDTLDRPANTPYRFYTARDRATGQFFRVESIHYSEYFQATDYETFMKGIVDTWTAPGDTILSHTLVPGESGTEHTLVVTNTRTGTTDLVRWVLRGRHLLQIWTVLNGGDRDSVDGWKFLSSLKLEEGPVEGDLFSPKAERLLADLASTSPQTRLRARREVDAFPFTATYLDDIMEGLERKYPLEEDDLDETRTLLVRALARVDDPSIPERLARFRRHVADEEIELREAIVQTLLNIGTGRSIPLALEQLVEDRRRGLDLDVGLYPIVEHLAAAKDSWRLLAELARDHDYRPVVFWLTEQALDSGTLGVKELGGSPGTLAEECRRTVAQYLDPPQQPEYMKRAGGPGPYEVASAARLLSRIAPEPASFVLLHRLTGRDDPVVLLAAVLGLARMGELPDHDVLELLAADSSIALDLYDGLHQAGRDELFPASAKTQRAFATADLARWIARDTADWPDEIRYLARREVEGIGRFFLFKFRLDPEGDWLVGISGPQPIDESLVSSRGASTRTLYRAYEEMSLREHMELLRTTEE